MSEPADYWNRLGAFIDRTQCPENARKHDKESAQGKRRRSEGRCDKHLPRYRIYLDIAVDKEMQLCWDARMGGAGERREMHVSFWCPKSMQDSLYTLKTAIN